MITRLSVMLLTLVFSLSVLANPQSGVKQAFDEFRYTMEVEGAALNPELEELAVQTLEARLLKLKQSGMSEEAILEAALKNVKNSSTRSQLQEAIALIQAEKLSAIESKEFIQSILLATPLTGASWEVPEAVQAIAVLGLMLAAAVGLLIVVGRNSSCPTNYPAETCANWDNRFDD